MNKPLTTSPAVTEDGIVVNKEALAELNFKKHETHSSENVPSFTFDRALLKDKSLEGVNPWATDLTEEVKVKIQTECLCNSAYFSAVVKINPSHIEENHPSNRNYISVTKPLAEPSRGITVILKNASETSPSNGIVGNSLIDYFDATEMRKKHHTRGMTTIGDVHRAWDQFEMTRSFCSKMPAFMDLQQQVIDELYPERGIYFFCPVPKDTEDQLTVSTLLDFMRSVVAVCGDIKIYNGFGAASTYRGYYDQLAFEPCAETTAVEMLKHVATAFSLSLSGKGETPTKVDNNTLVNIATWSSCGDEDEITCKRMNEIIGEKAVAEITAYTFS